MTINNAMVFGSEPIRIKWNVVRGDSASISIDFLENDEVTGFDTDGWEYISTAYDAKTDTAYDLEIAAEGHSLTVTATPDITSEWGIGFAPYVSELLFDIQVTDGDLVWTPIVGYINVSVDVSGAL